MTIKEKKTVTDICCDAFHTDKIQINKVPYSSGYVISGTLGNGINKDMINDIMKKLEPICKKADIVYKSDSTKTEFAISMFLSRC